MSSIALMKADYNTWLAQQVKKSDLGTSSSTIRQQWKARTLHALEEEYKHQSALFPPAGYATSIRNVRQEPSGEWTCTFVRWTSCD